MRFRTMSIDQLYTRLNKITDKQKLLNFIHCCGEKENNLTLHLSTAYHKLKQAARGRYEHLFPDSKNSVMIIEPEKEVYFKPHSVSSGATGTTKIKYCRECGEEFILQKDVDGNYCSEKCWRLGAYNNWEKKEFGNKIGNKKGYVDYKSTPVNATKKTEPSKPVDFIDVLPKRKLRLD